MLSRLSDAATRRRLLSDQHRVRSLTRPPQERQFLGHGWCSTGNPAILIMNTLLVVALGSEAQQPFGSLRPGRKSAFWPLQRAVALPSVACGVVQNS